MRNKTNQKKIAIILPAYNEELVIADTIHSLLRIVDPEDIFVVNDGSDDQTESIARTYVPNVVSFTNRQGKASAINTTIERFNLTETYQYLMPVDADTQITSSFINDILEMLEKDTNQEYACAVGRVTGRDVNWLTTYRMWEYEVSQAIHKTAQGLVNAIVVCPGCATIYRSSIFKYISFPSRTVTEDMDLTFQIHRKRLGRIGFVAKAAVVTQDPQSLPEYAKQLSRWYTGFWQCIFKNNIPWGGQRLDAEVAILASEGLFNGLVSLVLVPLFPLILKDNPTLIVAPVLFDLFLFFIPTLLITKRRYNLETIFRYLPLFYFMRVFSSLIFLYSFSKLLITTQVHFKWKKVNRYQISQKHIWLNPSYQ